MTLPPLYRPGEVDDAVYGPAEPSLPSLPLPQWRPSSGEEREAFMGWCLTMLDRIAEDEDLEPAFQTLMKDDAAVQLLREMVDQPDFDRARKLMPYLSRKDFERFRYGPEATRPRNPKKLGRKANKKVRAAVIDNERLTMLWVAHFEGKKNRPCKPSRLDILERRHSLDPSERDTVENYISKLR